MAKHCVRIERVTKDDYDKVMDMFPPDEIYNGTDYLPDYFHMVINMTNVEAYAAVKDNKFVSFTLFSFVDDGKTVVSRAVRTRKGYERQGLNSIIMKFCQAVSFKEKLLEYYTTFSGIHMKDIYKKLETGERYKVLQRDFRCFVCSSPKEVYEKLNTQTKINPSAKLVTKEDFGDLLANSEFCDRFFPEGRVTIDGVPYRMIRSNASLVMTERTSVILSDSCEFENSLLTFMNWFRAHLGLIYSFDIYGLGYFTIKEHLIMHFKNTLLVNRYDNVMVRCFCSEGTNWNSISTLMSDLGLEERTIWDTGIICTEQRACF